MRAAVLQVERLRSGSAQSGRARSGITRGGPPQLGEQQLLRIGQRGAAVPALPCGTSRLRSAVDWRKNSRTQWVPSPV